MSSIKIAPVFSAASQQTENKSNNADSNNNNNDKDANDDDSNNNNIESLRAANAQLKQENQELKKQIAKLSKKRKAPETATSAAAAPAASKKAKTPAQRNKLFSKWSKALERLSAKEKITNAWGGETFKTTIKETTPWTPADFDSVFGEYEAMGGVKIQPRPDFKPTSQITLLQWSSAEQVQSLFGKDNDGNQIISKTGYKVQTWRSRNFCKSYQTGMASATLKGLLVEYNKANKHSNCYLIWKWWILITKMAAVLLYLLDEEKKSGRSTTSTVLSIDCGA